MPVIKVDPSKLGEEIRRLNAEALKGVIKVVQDTVLTEGERIVQEEISATTPVPVDRGTYRRGWRVAVLKDGAVLYNPVFYAPIIEHGRRPGRMPPIGAIERWVMRKGIAGGKLRGKWGAKQRSHARNIAFMIARKLARKGMVGRRILARTTKRLTPAVTNAVVAYLRVGG